jgi:exosortase/archaeosortase family protein
VVIRNLPTLAFGVKFAVIFALLTGAFEASRGSAVERFLVEDLILKPATAMISALDPHDTIQLTDRTISSPGSKLHVTRGCEGVEIFLLLAAATLAFPASWKARAWGLGIGFLLAYALSLSRLAALHFTLRYMPNAWESLHGFVLPLGPIVLTTMYFLAWTGRQKQRSVSGPLGNPA